jgi:hypothetical protein
MIRTVRSNELMAPRRGKYSAEVLIARAAAKAAITSTEVTNKIL